MPTYIYETIPEDPEVAPVRYEFRQGMSEAPLARHPETGEPVRRVISGGLGAFTAAGEGSAAVPAPPRLGCSGGCACHPG